jgi:hypothetical protein
LITHVNLSIYEEEYQYIHSTVARADTICKQVIKQYIENKENSNFTPKCDKNIDEINTILNEINEYHSKWFVTKKHRLNRTKRGLFKSMLGFLDDEEAKQYLDNFKVIEEQNQNQNMIITKQTTLINSAINTMNNNIVKNNKTTMELIKQINHFIDQQTVTLWIYNVKFQLSELMDHISLIIIQFLHKQKLYLSAISAGQNNPNNPDLIPPQMFYQELTKIRTAVQEKKLDLPFELTENNLATFYKISSAASRIVDNNLIISFSLPLIDNTEYILYKSTSAPYRIKDNLFSFIIPHHEYVALDTFKEKYIPITENELQNCYDLNKNNLICKQTFPKMSAINTKICEINLLRMEKVDHECNIRVANLTAEMWIKLKQENTYIFTFPSKQYIYITCGSNERYSQFVENTGVISINPNCQIKTDTLIIMGFQTLTTTLYRNISTSIKLDFEINDLIQDVTKLNNFKIPQIDFPNIINDGQNKDLELISYSIEDIENMQNKLKNKLYPTDFKKDILSISGILIFITIIILIIIIKYLRRKIIKLRSRANNDNQPIIISAPTPFPRNNSPAFRNRSPALRMPSITTSNEHIFEMLPPLKPQIIIHEV